MYTVYTNYTIYYYSHTYLIKEYRRKNRNYTYFYDFLLIQVDNLYNCREWIKYLSISQRYKKMAFFYIINSVIIRFIHFSTNQYYDNNQKLFYSLKWL